MSFANDANRHLYKVLIVDLAGCRVQCEGRPKKLGLANYDWITTSVTTSTIVYLVNHATGEIAKQKGPKPGHTGWHLKCQP